MYTIYELAYIELDSFRFECIGFYVETCGFLMLRLGNFIHTCAVIELTNSFFETLKALGVANTSRFDKAAERLTENCVMYLLTKELEKPL